MENLLINSHCVFCGSRSPNMRVTLYEKAICEECHNILKSHDIRKDIEDLDRRIKEYTKSNTNYKIL